MKHVGPKECGKSMLGYEIVFLTYQLKNYIHLIYKNYPQTSVVTFLAKAMVMVK